MARRRFFVPPVHNGRAELTGEDAHHLTRVLRVERGHRYEISDGTHVFLAEITEAHKNRVLFQLLEPVEPTVLPVSITLLISLIKFDRMEWIFEKGTEIGVERFIPVVTDRSEKGLDRAVEKRRERWERILVESSQQSRRDRVPELAEALHLGKALQIPAPVRLVLEEDRAAGPILKALPADRAPGVEALLLAGPEGGWTERERDLAKAADWLPVSLGPQILRSETAAVAAASIVVAAWS